jgi:hypothetical protein
LLLVRARAPLDVDLEDKLLYGLTPARLAYVVLSLLGGFALWSSHWAPSPVRAAACLAVIGIGSGTAWGRWRGRAVDAWIGDASLFLINTHRIAFNRRWGRHLAHLPKHSSAPSAPAGPIVVLVADRSRDAGAAAIATQLSECFAAAGYTEELWSIRPALIGHDHRASASSVLLWVAAVDGGRVFYLDRGAGPFVAGVLLQNAPAIAVLKLIVEVIVAGDG